MKNFDNLTETELVDLSTDEINFYVDLACAEAGVPLLGLKPTEPELPAQPAHDLTVYILKCGYTKLAVFHSFEDAQRVLNVVRGCALYDEGYVSGPSYEKKFTPINERDFSIETTSGYSDGTAALISGLLADRKTAQDAYTKAKTEWEKGCQTRESIAADIRSKIAEARANDQRRRFLRDQFDRYTILAEGHQGTAARFLMKAYPDVPELLPDVAELASVRSEA